MAQTLNSRILLAKNIKLDRNYKNVLSYNVANMLQIINSNLVISANNFSFLRNQKSLYVPFSYTDCIQSNYLAFQNPDYSNKWFFAWVDDVIYKNDKTTEITYTLDVWTTFFGDLEPKQCFVVREHVDDDTIGLHTIPENLNIGDYKSNLSQVIKDGYNNIKNNMRIVVASTIDFAQNNKDYFGKYNGVPSRNFILFFSYYRCRGRAT